MQAFGAPVLAARIRCVPEDFRVEELDGFEASGDGEHLLLTIEKRGMNTGFVAGEIARWAGVPEVAVGYAGLKDRHAVTVQRFSVQVTALAAQVEAQRRENAGLEERNAALAAEVRDLKEGVAAVEERARSELGMIKPGEVFYRVVEDTPPRPLPPPPAAEED